MRVCGGGGGGGGGAPYSGEGAPNSGEGEGICPKCPPPPPYADATANDIKQFNSAGGV